MQVGSLVVSLLFSLSALLSLLSRYDASSTQYSLLIAGPFFCVLHNIGYPAEHRKNVLLNV